MPRSGCSALHGVNPNYKKKEKNGASFEFKLVKEMFTFLSMLKNLLRPTLIIEQT